MSKVYKEDPRRSAGTQTSNDIPTKVYKEDPRRNAGAQTSDNDIYKEGPTSDAGTQQDPAKTIAIRFQARELLDNLDKATEIRNSKINPILDFLLDLFMGSGRSNNQAKEEQAQTLTRKYDVQAKSNPEAAKLVGEMQEERKFAAQLESALKLQQVKGAQVIRSGSGALNYTIEDPENPKNVVMVKVYRDSASGKPSGRIQVSPSQEKRGPFIEDKTPSFEIGEFKDLKDCSPEFQNKLQSALGVSAPQVSEAVNSSKAPNVQTSTPELNNARNESQANPKNPQTTDTRSAYSSKQEALKTTDTRSASFVERVTQRQQTTERVNNSSRGG